MANLVPNAVRDDWYMVATQELKHLQDEFRSLQGESHAVVGVGVTLTGLALGIGSKLSYSLAALFATLAIGIAMTWYLNINADAEIVGRARDDLGREINKGMNRGGMKRAIYCDAVQAAGSMSAGAISLLSLFGLLAASVSGAGCWLAFQAPSDLGDRFYLPDGWREAAQILLTVLIAATILLAIYENRRGYPRRYAAAL